MQKYRLFLILLCLALLGALPFIVSVPKPASADMRQAAISQMRPEIAPILQQAFRLSEANNYDAALMLIDGLNALPDKTNLEVQEINQVRDLVVTKQRRP